VIDTKDRVFFLANSHLFRGLGEDELTVVAEQLEEVSLPSHATVIEQGAPADNFFLIYRGAVQVSRKVKQQEQQLATLVAGDYFGKESFYYNQRQRSATVTTLEDVVLLELSNSTLQELLKKYPKIKVNFEVSFSSLRLARRLRFKWVRPDEVIYFIARKHLILLVQGLIGPVFAFLLALVLILLFGRAFFHSIFTSLITIFVLIGIIGWGVWSWIDWGNDYYIVTNQRVVWLEKVVGIYDSRQEAPLSKILSVGVETALSGRLLDYGNVIVRTFVGRIPFRFVDHPYQAAAIVEEYWRRAQETSHREDVNAMKQAIREKLGLAETKKIIKPLAPEKKTMPSPYKPSLLMVLSRDIFRLRFEERGTITYRKHLFVLLQQVSLPSLFIILDIFTMFFRLRNIALSPDVNFISITQQGVVQVDTFMLVLIIFLVLVFLPWWLYQYLDWSNDIFQVTQDQIFDIDKKPFGTEQRRSAPLDSILSTRAARIGPLGYIINYGNVYISVGSAELVFESVFDPVAVQLDIDMRRLAHNTKRQEAKDKAERENMAEWLATYHQNFGDLDSTNDLTNR
jgi:hypothetical protein